MANHKQQTAINRDPQKKAASITFIRTYPNQRAGPAERLRMKLFQLRPAIVENAHSSTFKSNPDSWQTGASRTKQLKPFCDPAAAALMQSTV
jgi:hypothetical protein